MSKQEVVIVESLVKNVLYVLWDISFKTDNASSVTVVYKTR